MRLSLGLICLGLIAFLFVQCTIVQADDTNINVTESEISTTTTETTIISSSVIYCKNGGEAIDGKCVCPEPYKGKYCDYAYNPCNYIYCNNGGTCELDQDQEPTCKCKESFSGFYCEYKTKCADKRCENGGVCYMKEINYGTFSYNNEVCNCTWPYIGENCETKLEKPRVFHTPDEQCASALGKSFQASRNIIRGSKRTTAEYIYTEYLCGRMECVDLKGLGISINIIPENGTLCGDGKICLGHECIDYPNVPKFSVNDKPITETVNCKNYFRENPGFEKNLCSSELKEECKIACKKYNLIQCQDKERDCPKFSLGCTDGLFGNSTDKISDLCPYTCNTCPEFPVKCPTDEEICMNGGQCTDIKNPSNKKFAFKCKCPAGFSGELCEEYIMSPCTPNPCPENLKCIKIGQLSYMCTNNTSTPYVRKLIVY